MYGDFIVIMMKDCGFVNATKLCSSGQKDFKHWFSNKSCKELLQALSTKLMVDEACQNTPYNFPKSDAMLLDTKVGIPTLPSAMYKHVQTKNQSMVDKLISGTYCHPLLIPHIACWVSADFALKVSEIVNNHFIDEYKRKLDETRTALYDAEQSIASLENQIITKDEMIQMNEDTIDISQQTITSLAGNIEQKDKQQELWSSTHAFTVLKTNDASTPLPYYVIRCKRTNLGANVNKLRLKYPKAQVIWQLNKITNPVNMYSRLKSGKHITTFRNFCNPTSSNEEQFLETMDNLAGKGGTWMQQ